MIYIVVIATGLLVWHATRASQAHAGIQTRRAQIRGLWRDVFTFVVRGFVMLFLFIIVMVVALKHLSGGESAGPGAVSPTEPVAGEAREPDSG